MSEILTDMVLVEWTKEDDLTLLEQITRVVPENASIHYLKRCDSINWEKVT
jgi:hypothetical protein